MTEEKDILQKNWKLFAGAFVGISAVGSLFTADPLGAFPQIVVLPLALFFPITILMVWIMIWVSMIWEMMGGTVQSGDSGKWGLQWGVAISVLVWLFNMYRLISNPSVI